MFCETLIPTELTFANLYYYIFLICLGRFNEIKFTARYSFRVYLTLLLTTHVKLANAIMCVRGLISREGNIFHGVGQKHNICVKILKKMLFSSKK